MGYSNRVKSMVAYEKQKIVTSYACFCLETMLSSQTIKEIIEPLLKFLGARIRAIKLFQFGINKP